MKRILIITPHYPPSNLAAVHRSRLFAQHLPAFGWEPIILTVHEDYYEEELDWNLHKLLPAHHRIEKVKAFKVTKPRLIGDIGLRAFFQLYKRANQLIKSEGFDFLFIPIPSFYTALLGRMLYNSTGIQYGIDYVDPWVHDFPGSNEVLSRPWFAKKLANILEPLAVKQASLITGVAEGYYEAVLERNPHLKKQAIVGAMPYGGEEKDHEALHKLDLKPYLFQKKEGKIVMVYAGAMLPRAYAPLEAIFKSISEQPDSFADVEFHFIGTGSIATDAGSFNVKPLAEKYGLWQHVVFEYPKRIPYLDVLLHLQEADGIFILGSTEPHYTPSKAYQGVLSSKPIMAVLHKASTAVDVLQKAGAAIVLDFNGEQGVVDVKKSFAEKWKEFKNFKQRFHPGMVNKELFSQFSARAVTNQLVNLLNEIS